MDYIRYSIEATPETSEILMAFLGEMPFDTFTESESGLEAYIPESEDKDWVEEAVKEMKAQFSFSYQKKRIQYQNWNQIWESNFKPVSIEGFCGVRADFHPPFKNVEHEIIINPRMAFGTGHHATTYMMMEFMQEINFEGKSVFDYGCGTGILAILAAKMNAGYIEGVDIEEPAYKNSIENSKNNQAEQVIYHHGTLDDVPSKEYEMILANINRNVILQSLPSLYQRLKPGGMLITSGYLIEDQELMRETHTKEGFWISTDKTNGKWKATQAFKRY